MFQRTNTIFLKNSVAQYQLGISPSHEQLILPSGIVLLILPIVFTSVHTEEEQLLIPVISIYNKSFDLKALAASNKTAANQLIGIRNELLQIISDLHMMKKDTSTINDAFAVIMQRLNKLYVEMPTTTRQSVDAAREALKVNKDYTFSESEIDMFLPPSLQGKIGER